MVSKYYVKVNIVDMVTEKEVLQEINGYYSNLQGNVDIPKQKTNMKLVCPTCGCGKYEEFQINYLRCLNDSCQSVITIYPVN